MLAAAGATALVVAGCSQNGKMSRVDPRYGVSPSPRVVEPGQPVPKGGGAYRVGKPYQVAGRLYVPEENRRYRAEGTASWYGDDFHGRLTANGEVYDMESVSAAHPTLPMPSYARVTNLHNGRSLIVRVNDRGPYHSDRVIDLSSKAADLLGFRGRGTSRVRVEYVGPASLEGSDDRKLMATLREGAPAPAPSAVMLASTKPFVPAEPSSRRIPAVDVITAERTGDGATGRGQRVAEWTTERQPPALRRTADPVIANAAVGPASTAYTPSKTLILGRGLY